VVRQVISNELESTWKESLVTYSGAILVSATPPLTERSTRVIPWGLKEAGE